MKGARQSATYIGVDSRKSLGLRLSLHTERVESYAAQSAAEAAKPG